MAKDSISRIVSLYSMQQLGAVDPKLRQTLEGGLDKLLREEGASFLDMPQQVMGPIVAPPELPVQYQGITISRGGYTVPTQRGFIYSGLTDSGRGRLLRYLLANPNREFSEAELKNISGLRAPLQAARELSNAFERSSTAYRLAISSRHGGTARLHMLG